MMSACCFCLVLNFALTGLQAEKPLLPYSHLPLELVGIIRSPASQDKSLCLVRLKSAPKNAVWFRPGDKIFQIAELQRVEREGIVIKNVITGSQEYLTYAKNTPLSPPPSAPPDPPIAVTSANQFVIKVTPEIVRYYTLNLSDILDSAYAAPHYGNRNKEKDSIEGFEIRRIKPGGIVDRLGFRNSDIILEVNGEALDSLDKVIQWLGKTQNAPEAVLTVLRDGKKIKFVFKRN